MGARRHRRLASVPPGTGELESLLRRSSAGDEAAFAQLFDATAPRVYGAACRLTASPADAEEVACSAYAEIWRSASRYDPRHSTALVWMLEEVRRRAEPGGPGPRVTG